MTANPIRHSSWSSSGLWWAGEYFALSFDIVFARWGCCITALDSEDIGYIPDRYLMLRTLKYEASNEIAR